MKHVADIWWKAEDIGAEEKLTLFFLYRFRSERQRRTYAGMSVQEFRGDRNGRHCAGLLSSVGILSKSGVVNITWSKVQPNKERGATKVEAK